MTNRRKTQCLEPKRLARKGSEAGDLEAEHREAKPRRPGVPSARRRPPARPLFCSPPARPLFCSALAWILLVGCSGPAGVDDRYVDPISGSDAHPGSSSEPFRTLTHALSGASGGTVIHLAAGTYDAASGEVWPTFVGLPPTAAATVPAGVTITGDGDLVRLAGPAGYDDQVALVFDADATLRGVNVVGFEVGLLAVSGASVVLDDVHVSGTGEYGVLARGDAELTVRDSSIFQSAAVGLGAMEDANVTLDGSQVYQNLPGIEISDAATVTIRDSDVYGNGSGTPGGVNSGMSVLDDAHVSIQDSSLRDNAYAGLHLQGAFDVTVGSGTVIEGNFIGVVADAFQAGAASLAFDGATVRDNAYEGVFWAIPSGASFTLRDTAVNDNGDNGLHFLGDAAVIDLGTVTDPGGNDYAGNGEPLILDERPARAAPDGTIISISHEDVLTACAVPAGPAVGPASFDCDGVNAVDIVNANNRVAFVGGD